MQLRVIMLGVLFFLGVMITVPAHAQTVGPGPRVQEINGSVTTADDYVYYDLFGLSEGQTIYIYAESNTIDTYLAFGNLDFSEVYIEDDDSGGGTNSVLQFSIPADGDYSIAVGDCCDNLDGDFRLLIGINAPDVLTGSAASTGDEIAIPYVGLTLTDCSELGERPQLSGPELTRETRNFIIHYTPGGRDGATEDFVNDVQSILENILTNQVEELGWPLPPADCGEGGDARFDVYLLDTLENGDLLGYAESEGLIGDNPASEIVEEYAAYSYLVIDNNFAGVPAPRDVMRATTAHEFHHAIQFGYDLNDLSGWYYEATATWMETQTFPAVEDASPYVVDLFETPDLCIGAEPEDPMYGSRIYAEWLLIDSIAQDYGHAAIRQLWEVIAREEGMPAFYAFLDELGTDPQTVLTRFAVRNLLLDYQIADRFGGRVKVEANINSLGTITPRYDGVQELSVDYVYVATKGQYTFAINQPNLSLIAVGVNQPNKTAQIFEMGQGGTVDFRPYSYGYIIILNTDSHDDPYACTVTDWELSVSDGTGAAPLLPTDEHFDASQFVPAG